MNIEQSDTPVFGEQAKWLCYKNGLNRDYAENHSRRMTRRPLLYDGCISDHADISLLYLVTSLPGRGIRLECPALRFSQTGPVQEVMTHFTHIADVEAGRLTGKCYTSNRDEYGCSLDSCVTIAWRGETKPVKCKTTRQGGSFMTQELLPIEQDFIAWCKSRNIDSSLAVRLASLWQMRERIAKAHADAASDGSLPSTENPHA